MRLCLFAAFFSALIFIFLGFMGGCAKTKKVQATDFVALFATKVEQEDVRKQIDDILSAAGIESRSISTGLSFQISVCDTNVLKAIDLLTKQNVHDIPGVQFLSRRPHIPTARRDKEYRYASIIRAWRAKHRGTQ